jgi:N-succinyldiaminopimelate aminotransferase
MRSWIAKRVSAYTDSVFEQATALARQYGAINMGSGTPDCSVPETIQNAVAQAMARGHNQYAPVRGEQVLREAVAAHAGRFYGQTIDPNSEVSITSGVTEAMYAALVSIVDPGDEVIVFEPFYDSYVPGIQMAGGTPVAVTLHAPSFRFDPQELRAAFTRRPRALIVNTPHNPTGTVFTAAELTMISELCQEYDVLAITDEVYEHVVFDAKHVRLATLPGMWQRTLTLSGAGKAFSCTGWRIGWAIGPAPLQDALCRLRQFTVFSSPTPFQFAIAAGLHFPDAFFHQLAAGYKTRRDFMVSVLDACGLKPTSPAGAFFILTDISAFLPGNGRAFCNDLPRRFGVAAIPMDNLYVNQHCGQRIARFTFCLGQEALDIAARRLATLNPRSWANR